MDLNLFGLKYKAPEIFSSERKKKISMTFGADLHTFNPFCKVLKISDHATCAWQWSAQVLSNTLIVFTLQFWDK